MLDRVKQSSVGKSIPVRANFLQSPAAAYIHLPFCLSKCGYCDFVSYAGRADQIPAYVKALRAEITRLSHEPLLDVYGRLIPAVPLKTVYFGGGTPGDLPADALIEILDCLDRSIGLAEDAEISLEVNPGSTSPGLLPAVRAAGFNRLSIGLQTARDPLLKRLGRRHVVADFEDLLEKARMAGFSNISADMMLALPGESLEDSRYTATFLLDMGLPHISFYSLTVEPGTAFAQLYPAGRGLPSDEVERQMYRSALAAFEAQGYRQYEVSNVALPGYESRHNLTYWQGLPYYGFGCGAASFIGGFRRLQTADLDCYIRAEGRGTAALEEKLNELSAMEEFFFLGFRTATGVSAADFIRQFGRAWPSQVDRSLKNLLLRGLIRQVEQGGGRFVLTAEGLDLANQVYMEFLDLSEVPTG